MRFRLVSTAALGLAVPAALVVLGLVLARSKELSAAPSAPPSLVLVPDVTAGVRELVPLPAKLFVYDPLESGGELRLVTLRVWSGRELLEERALDTLLVGDPEYGEIQALRERLPAGLSHRQIDRRYYAAPAAPPIEGPAAVAAWKEAQPRAAVLQQRYLDLHSAGRPLPFTEYTIELPLERVFAADDSVGAEHELRFEVEALDGAGQLVRAEVDAGIRRLAPWPRALESMQKLAGYTIHRGDLHVHSCHGEPVIPCSFLNPLDLCPAESGQLLSPFSYTYNSLKLGYVALGIDWFTATDHSYCVSTVGTYNDIVAECAAITTPTFVAIPDIEVSSLEQGPQTGTDPFGDVSCLNLANANHMGAHGIVKMKPGGLPAPALPPGFCVGLNGFLANAAAVRAEGGYPIMNHPTDGFEWAWNSFASTRGIEGWQMHGTEIWGDINIGFGNHVMAWVDYLKAGRILYGYGGSDTHDTAPANFGVNHALVAGDFNKQSLQAAIKAGRVYVSNLPVAILEIVYGTSTLQMGTIQPVLNPPANITINVQYDFTTTPSGTGNIAIYKGTVGGPEISLASALVTGAGTFTKVDTLPAGVQSWYRGEGTSGMGSYGAYTNPVFFVPVGGPCFPQVYGTAAGGANVGSLLSISTLKLGSVVLGQISGLSNLPSAQAVLGISPVTLGPLGVPFLGGTLLIGLGPTTLTTGVPLSFGAATFSLGQIPINPLLVGLALYVQAAAVNTTLPELIGFTNGIGGAICP